jgi:pimeloyl-ACP methyl ester carboxylesterase
VKGWERAFWEFSTTPREFTITDNPEGLSLPTAIITGDDDRVVATEDSVALSKVVVGSTLAVIPQSGHLPHEETPDAFMESFSQAWASFGFAFSP